MNQKIDNPPRWEVQRWLNTNEPITLDSLKGRVVALHTFQMLCPGCISHGLPQATQIQKTFSIDDVAVIGLHTVFEHHDVMTPRALEVFVHEYGWSFPIGIDRPSKDGEVPQTMAAYGMRGTPSLLLFDHRGGLRHHDFGRAGDMLVGAKLMALLAERDSALARSTNNAEDGSEIAGSKRDCSDGSCAL